MTSRNSQRGANTGLYQTIFSLLHLLLIYQKGVKAVAVSNNGEQDGDKGVSNLHQFHKTQLASTCWGDPIDADVERASPIHVNREYTLTATSATSGTRGSSFPTSHHHHSCRRPAYQSTDSPQGEGGTSAGTVSGAEAECVADGAGSPVAWGVSDPKALCPQPVHSVSLSDSGLSSGRASPCCFYSLQQLHSWDWDFTGFTPDQLAKLAYDLVIASGAVEQFGLDPQVLRNFVGAAASGYRTVPYHNFNHAVYVMHAVYLISSTTGAAAVLSPLERFALLVAALCHDLDHDGRSNSFHVNSNSELSRAYGGKSVLENHHLAQALSLLARPGHDLLGPPLKPDQQNATRAVVAAAILATDMAHHGSLERAFKDHGTVYDSGKEEDRGLLLRAILHAADVGNAVRPFAVNHVLSRRVQQEFGSQAAEEARRGLPVTATPGRQRADVPACSKLELGFLDGVVVPLWEQLAAVLPELAPQLAQLRANWAQYRRMAESGGVEAEPGQDVLKTAKGCVPGAA